MSPPPFAKPQLQGTPDSPYWEFPFDRIVDFAFGTTYGVLTIDSAFSQTQVNTGQRGQTVGFPSITIPQSKSGFDPGDTIPFDTSPDGWKTPLGPDGKTPVSPGISCAQVFFDTSATGFGPPQIDAVYTPPTPKPIIEPVQYGTILLEPGTLDIGTLTFQYPVDGTGVWQAVQRDYQAALDSFNAQFAAMTAACGTTTHHQPGETVTTTTSMASIADCAPLLAAGAPSARSFGGCARGLPGVTEHWSYSLWDGGPGFVATAVNQPVLAAEDDPSTLAVQNINKFAMIQHTQWFYLSIQSTITPDVPATTFSTRQVYLFNFGQMAKDCKGLPSAGPNNDPTLVTLYNTSFPDFVDPGALGVAFANKYRLQIFRTPRFQCGPGFTLIGTPGTGTPPTGGNVASYDVTKTVPWHTAPDFNTVQVLQFNKSGWVDNQVPIAPF